MSGSYGLRCWFLRSQSQCLAQWAYSRLTVRGLGLRHCPSQGDLPTSSFLVWHNGPRGFASDVSIGILEGYSKRHYRVSTRLQESDDKGVDVSVQQVVRAVAGELFCGVIRRTMST